ncbi:MAG: ABC transporter substrate-binding protein, partial [Janthinobacterium lividum]
MVRTFCLSLAAGLSLFGAGVAQAQGPAAPSEIKVGILHASSGPYASISMPVFDGLKIWVDQVNAGGGVAVKPFGRKIPYDDQSNPGTAATLTNQLISQDKVDILLPDSGSVLTAVAVPIAREHKMMLFDTTGTGAPFFTKDNPYIALLADPASTVWPKYIADFLKEDGAAAGLKRIAILYATNDFTSTQATALRGFLEAAGNAVDIVYDQGVPTSTSNYTVILNAIAAAKPDAVIELGYVGNDIAFLRNLQDSSQSFPFVFTIYSGL